MDVESALQKADETLSGSSTEVPTPAATVSTPAPVSEPASSGPVAAPARNGKGQYLAKDNNASSPTTDAAIQATPKPQGDGRGPEVQSVPPPAAAPPAPTYKPPESWRPAAREHFGKLPPEVQAEVVRVHKEATRKIAELGEAGKRWSEVQQTLAPYEPYIRAEGGEPVKAIGTLMQTALALRTAPPVTRAKIVADIIRSYGVPVESVAAWLDGQMPQQGASQAQAEFRDPRVDQLLSQMEQRRTSAANQTVLQLADKFEFFEDVRESMADLIEMAARRGVTLDPEAAYHRAVAMDPDLGKIVAQREAAKTAATANAATQRAQAAASSVRSSPAAPPKGGKPRSIEEALAQADEVLRSKA